LFSGHKQVAKHKWRYASSKARLNRDQRKWRYASSKASTIGKWRYASSKASRLSDTRYSAKGTRENGDMQATKRDGNGPPKEDCNAPPTRDLNVQAFVGVRSIDRY